MEANELKALLYSTYMHMGILQASRHSYGNGQLTPAHAELLHPSVVASSFQRDAYWLFWLLIIGNQLSLWRTSSRQPVSTKIKFFKYIDGFVQEDVTPVC